MNESTSRAQLGILGFLSLFTSVSTLLCCALPALLVSIGMGMTVTSILSAAPWFVGIFRYKALIFAAGAACLAAGFFMVYGLRARRVCEDGTSCEIAGRYTRFVFWLSLVLYAIGFFMAYLYVPLISRFES